MSYTIDVLVARGTALVDGEGLVGGGGDGRVGSRDGGRGASS